MKNPKGIFLLFLAVTFGFTLHWLMIIVQNTYQLNIGDQTVESVLSLKNNTPDQLITPIDYNGTDFYPKTVTIKKGNYIAITNKNKDKLMWLVSDNPELNTYRGYGEGERLQLILSIEGSYKIMDKLNSKSLVHINVVP